MIIVKQIVSIEWDMFASVNEGKARASCQEDRATFHAMRAAQFSAWSGKAAESYLRDLEDARRGGRNLVEEKYIHMMKTTDPTLYGLLLSRVIPPSDAALALALEVSAMLLEQMSALFDEYPYVSSHGRPLYSASYSEVVSVETYQLGELLTYSETTLAALKEHIAALEKDGVSLSRIILENTVKHYGYRSLESAEQSRARQ